MHKRVLYWIPKTDNDGLRKTEKTYLGKNVVHGFACVSIAFADNAKQTQDFYLQNSMNTVTQVYNSII